MLLFMGLVAGAGPAPLGAQGSARVELGLAWFDVGADDAGVPAVELGLISAPVWRGVRVRAGSVVSARAARYGYAGLELPLPLGGGFELTPSLGAGGYWPGDGVDLGSPIEFRSSIGLEYRMGAGRWRLFLYHLSNAGLGERNPGLEVLGLSYAIRR